MQRLVPFLILAGGAVGLYFLWTRVFAPAKEGPKAPTIDDRNAREKAAAQAAAECAAKHGTFTRPTDAESNCTLPEPPEVRVPVNYGGCPDMQSCAGYDPRTGVTPTAPSPAPSQPPYQPTPPASSPTGTSGLFYRPTTYRTLGQ
jgi:hypothetical protein